MIRSISVLFAVVTVSATFAQQPPPKVTLTAKGVDVRVVLHDLFLQAKRNYVLDAEVRHQLYLSLTDVPFEEALGLVCRSASLRHQLNKGVYFIDPAPSETSKMCPEQADVPTPEPKGKLPESVMNRILTTRYERVEIRRLFAEISRQTGVQFEIDPATPEYRLDAYLLKTSLRYALGTICRAAKLEYAFTDRQSIRIGPKPEPKSDQEAAKKP